MATSMSGHGKARHAPRSSPLPAELAGQSDVLDTVGSIFADYVTDRGARSAADGGEDPEAAEAEGGDR